MNFKEIYKKHNKRYKVGDIVIVKQIRISSKGREKIRRSDEYKGEKGKIVQILDDDGFSYKIHFEDEDLLYRYADDKDIYKKV